MGYKRYYVYLLANRRKTVLYTGMCNDLRRRIWEHKHGVFPGFTKKYNCDQLVHFEEFDARRQAAPSRRACEPAGPHDPD